MAEPSLPSVAVTAAATSSVAAKALPATGRLLHPHASVFKQLLPTPVCLHADFLRSMYKRVNWEAFLEGAQAVSGGDFVWGAVSHMVGDSVCCSHQSSVPGSTNHCGNSLCSWRVPDTPRPDKRPDKLVLPCVAHTLYIHRPPDNCAMMSCMLVVWTVCPLSL